MVGLGLEFACWLLVGSAEMEKDNGNGYGLAQFTKGASRDLYGSAYREDEENILMGISLRIP